MPNCGDHIAPNDIPYNMTAHLTLWKRANIIRKDKVLHRLCVIWIQLQFDHNAILIVNLLQKNWNCYDNVFCKKCCGHGHLIVAIRVAAPLVLYVEWQRLTLLCYAGLTTAPLLPRTVLELIATLRHSASVLRADQVLLRRTQTSSSDRMLRALTDVRCRVAVTTRARCLLF